jgi:hypothetical protein
MGSIGYIAFITNEMTNINNQCCILVHGYPIKDWNQILILQIVEHIVDDSNLDNLTQVLIYSLLINGKIFTNKIK